MKNRVYIFFVICMLLSMHIFIVSTDFYQKELEINHQLYKISAQELQQFLGVQYNHIPTLSAKELKAKMTENPQLFVINVLPKSLYDDCHIVGSESVPLKELVQRAESWPRDTEIIVYCALDICDAGQKAYILLACMGFTNVVDYEGGIKEWYALGYPTNGPAQASYLHASFAKLPDELLSDLHWYCAIELP